MAEEAKVVETTTPTTTEPAQVAPVEQTWKDGEQFDAKKAQELIDKLRAENKELGKKAKKADELSEADQKRKDAELTELQKLQKENETLKAEKTEFTRRELQRQAAKKFSLPDELAKRLSGETLEDMEADAEALAKVLPKPSPNINPTNPGTQNAPHLSREQRKAQLLGGGVDIFEKGGGINFFEK